MNIFHILLKRYAAPDRFQSATNSVSCSLSMKELKKYVNYYYYYYYYYYYCYYLYSWESFIHSQAPNMSIFFHIFFHVSVCHGIHQLVLTWCFCLSWDPSIGSYTIVALFLFSSYRAASTGKSSSVNDYLPFWGGAHTNSVTFFESYLKLIFLLAFLLLMVMFEIFCNLDILADFLK